jgi:hypothetical protein
LDPFGQYKLNYFEGDTLKLDITKQWGIQGFEGVIGNPPYNDTSGNKGKGHTLWTKFVEQAINTWLCENACLLYVHPSAWRQVNHVLYKLITSYIVHYLEIHHEKDGLKTFKCNTRYDWYVLQKKHTKQYNTIIKDQEDKLHEIVLQQWKFLPNCKYDNIYRLLYTDESNKCNIIHSESSYEPRKRWMSKQKTEGFEYPVVNTIYKDNTFGLNWSNTKNNGHYNIPKVIIRKATPIVGFVSDKEGEYAMTQWTLGIVAHPNEHDNVISVIRGDTFQQIIKAISLRNEISVEVLRLFKAKFWNYL